MSDIFLSYAREDQERAKSVVDALKSKGRSVFFDPKIVPGQTWDQMQKDLDAACCVTVQRVRSAVPGNGEGSPDLASIPQHRGRLKSDSRAGPK